MTFSRLAISEPTMETVGLHNKVSYKCFFC
jgi:hypothetical protein